MKWLTKSNGPMKKTLAPLALAIALFSLPALAQQSTTTRTVERPAILDQAAEKLKDLAPTEAQAQGLMDIFMRELPHILDENFDPASMARQIQPEAERLLDPDQVQMLRAMSNETGPLMQIGAMNREERRALMKGGLERLSHPDMREWLKRIDSFDI